MRLSQAPLAATIPLGLWLGTGIAVANDAVPQADHVAPDVAALEHSLETDGPRKTIQAYFNCDTRNPGYRLVESGDPEAVEVAVELLDQSDACVSETLLSSLAMATTANPDAVLPYVDRTPLLAKQRSSLCVPFISAEDVSTEDASAILETSKRALEQVSRPDLQQAKQACLDEIAKYRQAMDRAVDFHKRHGH